MNTGFTSLYVSLFVILENGIETSVFHSIHTNSTKTKYFTPIILCIHQTDFRLTEANANLQESVKSGDAKAIEASRANFLQQSKDALSDWLDKKYGSTITENSIFESLPRYWENEFHKDMNALNVSE